VTHSDNVHSSMQYHVLSILLHRPFLAQKTAGNSTSPKPPAASESEQGHAKVCRFSADKIAQIFRTYRSNYTLVSRTRLPPSHSPWSSLTRTAQHSHLRRPRRLHRRRNPRLQRQRRTKRRPRRLAPFLSGFGQESLRDERHVVLVQPVDPCH
jgi:hypothetical protein